MDCRNDACGQPQDKDIMDIPLNDPEANKAATKIQAGFRGHMTRKKMKDDNAKEEVSGSGPDESVEEALNGSLADSEAAGAQVEGGT